MDGKYPLTIEHLQRMRIPKIHWDCTLEAIPKSCRHREALIEWVTDVENNVKEAKGLLLAGEFSQGKSGAAAICLKAAAAHQYIGCWVSAGDLPGLIINDTMFDEEMSWPDRCKSVPILVIDEVQIRPSVKYTEQTVERIVRSRVDDKLCTILTTNHGVADLRTKYRALAEVLQEAVRPIVVDGYNWREAIANRES